MLTKEQILFEAKQEEKITTSYLSKKYSVSRQYASFLVKNLVSVGLLVKIGSTFKAFYVLPEYASKHIEIFPTKISRRLKNKNLEEHKVLEEVENSFPLILKLKENIRSIFVYAFSEMLNNAIEHSESSNIEIEVSIKDKHLTFHVNDFGVGVFRNIMDKRKLNSELEAVQDLLKGKTTTIPKSHSGEGIFFTSKVADMFFLESFNYRLLIDNKISDIFLNTPQKSKIGTKVTFSISTESDKHLNDIFKKYTSIGDGNGIHGFDKTEIKIKLYTLGGVHVSRSQARRVLSGLEKFNSIIFDFDEVPMVGQAFADEIFRVFQNKYPNIKIQSINTNEAVKFMIDRAIGNNPRTPKIFEEYSENQ